MYFTYDYIIPIAKILKVVFVCGIIVLFMLCISIICYYIERVNTFTIKFQYKKTT